MMVISNNYLLKIYSDKIEIYVSKRERELKKIKIALQAIAEVHTTLHNAFSFWSHNLSLTFLSVWSAAHLITIINNRKIARGRIWHDRSSSYFNNQSNFFDIFSFFWERTLLYFFFSSAIRRFSTINGLWLLCFGGCQLLRHHHLKKLTV